MGVEINGYHLFQTKNSPNWRYWFEDERGKRLQRSTGVSDLAEAKRFLRRLESAQQKLTYTCFRKHGILGYTREDQHGKSRFLQ